MKSLLLMITLAVLVSAAATAGEKVTGRLTTFRLSETRADMNAMRVSKHFRADAF